MRGVDMAKMDKELTSLILDGPEKEYAGEVVSWEELEKMTGKTREWFERELERIRKEPDSYED